MTVYAGPSGHEFQVLGDPYEFFGGDYIESPATSGTILTLALDNVERAYNYTFSICARSQVNSDAGRYTFNVSCKTDGTDATVIGYSTSEDIVDSGLSGCALEAIASGNTVLIRATNVSDVGFGCYGYCVTA